MKVNHNQFLLWFGAAISIAEIITGTLIAPLGLVKGSLAIIIGHLIGAFLLLLPASFLGGTRHQNAIELTAPIYGKIGFILFAILNVIQLIGWTGIMIANAAQAMRQLKLTHLSYLMNAIIVAGLIIFWLAIKTQFFFKLNNSIVLLLVVACLGLFWQLSQFAWSRHSSECQSTELWGCHRAQYCDGPFLVTINCGLYQGFKKAASTLFMEY
ncbi:hypothetical protein QY895_11280 [Latilactobacillus sakei]